MWKMELLMHGRIKIMKMKKGLLVLVMIFLALNSYGQVGWDIYKIGEEKSNKGDFIEAIKDYTIAIEIENPIYKDALKSYYTSRGVAKQKVKDHRGAIDDYTKAISLVPKDSDHLYNARGSSKSLLKNYPDAILDFSKAIEINPKQSRYYAGRGLARILNNERDLGCRDFSKAGELGYETAYDLISDYCN
jgi:tetratricopeptide (TPR) repeat protein